MGRYALILLLFGCEVTPAPNCHTHCGMAVYGVGPRECLRLQPFEDEGVEEFAYLYPALCERLGTVGMRVWKVDGGSWNSPHGQVSGLTYCDLATVEVANTNWWGNAYWHEMAHVAQCPFQDYGHETWPDAGIWASLDRLKKGWRQ